MPRNIHLQLDIRGTLLNWSPNEWINVMRDDDGRMLSPREAKSALLDKLAAGWKYLPIGGPCDGFDPVTGCPGHDGGQGGE